MEPNCLQLSLVSPLGLKKGQWQHHAWIVFSWIRCTLVYPSSPRHSWPWQISSCSLGQISSLWCFRTCCFIIETISACWIDWSRLQASEDLWIWTWNSNGVRCFSYYRVSKRNCRPCLACHTKITFHGFLSLWWID